VFYEHEVVVSLYLRIENPAPIRRDRQAIDKGIVGCENLADLSGREIEVLEGLGASGSGREIEVLEGLGGSGGHEVNATLNNCPTTMIIYGRHATQR
jgi:hypothetical protein